MFVRLTIDDYVEITDKTWRRTKFVNDESAANLRGLKKLHAKEKRAAGFNRRKLRNLRPLHRNPTPAASPARSSS